MLPSRLTDGLDPAYAAWMEASNPPVAAGAEPTLEQMRAGFARQGALSNRPAHPDLEIEDATILARDGHAVPVRFYRVPGAAGAAPCCCFVHGGGWVLGDLDTHDGVARDIAARTGGTVVAVDYRRAPEHVFPIPSNDVEDVLRSLVDAAARHRIDASRIALVGDSAGANLAAAAALRLRGTRAAPRALALVYPALGADIDRPSFVANRDVPGLTPALMTFFFKSYIGGEVLPHALAAPLTVDDLAGLPPTFVSGAAFDPLLDDATGFAERLRAADVPVVSRVEPTLGHGYLWVRRVSPAAATAFEALTDFLTRAT